ncbi:MAG: hypothetical protein CVU77_03540 [Elusimicrobia bacterium HGW-Elusimicrobia-1]|jgi:Zn-dependent peptidase ImmA (M78 family)|nr:MAG: hypothetical protein CVU77_03540 [Elusimicrobia bacterium HGW-Elusimicrobia-1]
MGKSNLIDITPQILTWAREEMQIKANDVAFELQINPETYNKWENSGKDIPFADLKILAKIFKRQLSCFFLPDVPKKSRRPTDHRNLNIFSSHLSYETSLAIRRVSRYKTLLGELNKQSYYSKKYQWLEYLRAEFPQARRIDNENIAEWIRNQMGFSIEDQLKTNSPSDAYILLRNLIEDKLGIPIFQFKMPIEEIQGFCYAEAMPYCIVVNSIHHAPTGKLFTLIHELGHVLKNQSSICYPEKVDKSENLELECNSFAGSLLVPAKVVTFIDTCDGIYKKARTLKISSEVYLRRMQTLKLIPDNLFFQLLGEIHSKVTKPVQGFAILTQVQKSINSRGRHLFNVVVEASKYNRISYSNASDILGLKINHFINL